MDTAAPEELVRRCQATLPEDTQAFEQLVALYKDRVFATAYRLMGNRQDAEDQAQEVFLKVYRGIKSLDDAATLTSWIYRITTNTCFDALNKQKRRPRTTTLAPPDDDGGGVAQSVQPRHHQHVVHLQFRQRLFLWPFRALFLRRLLAFWQGIVAANYRLRSQCT